MSTPAERARSAEDKAWTQSPATEFRQRLDTEPSHNKAWTQSPATKFRGTAKRRQSRATEPSYRAQGRGQEEDKAWTQSPATELEDKAWTQSPATEFSGAASECGQLYFSKIEPQQ